MLYEKNKSKQLDMKLFQNPTSEYRGTPFWSWNCKMTETILNKQIEDMKQMGFGGFHMHSRQGMDNAYMSEEFLSLIRSCTEKAKQEGMLAWLYDEDKYPSGFAGGLVTKDPELRSRRLAFAPANRVKMADRFKNRLCPDQEPLMDMSDETGITEAVRQGRPYFVAAFDIVLDEMGCLKSYDVIPRRAKAKGEKWVAFCETLPNADWFNGYTYVDSLRQKGIDRFVEVTHEKFKETVGEEFGKTVPAIFTDEPQWRCRITPMNTAESKSLCLIPWTWDLPKTYRKTFGEDLICRIPELFWSLPDGKLSTTNYRYMDHITQRFCDAFMKTCGKWCEKNGLPLTGHMMSEATLNSQTGMIGEAMRHYPYFGYPGIDMLCNYTELTTAKQAQSVVRQEGKEAMMSELYGVTNWDFDFRGHKYQGDWQAAMGVTIRVPHLTWVSMYGDAKRDYPATFGYQIPWYREYPYVEDHFARLNTALTRGAPEVSIGVIHPIESYWLHAGPNSQKNAIRIQRDEEFQQLCQWLIYGQLDFDYISEALLPQQCKKGKNPLQVGKMKYNAIVVPELDTIRSTTLKRLQQFREDGGQLIFLGQCPRYVDGVESDAAQELYHMSQRIPVNKNSLLQALEQERVLQITGQTGELADHYVYQIRRDGNSKWIFFANGKYDPEVDWAPVKPLTVKVKGTFVPTLFDTVSGKTVPLSYWVKNGWTYWNLQAYLQDSFLIRLDKGAKKHYEAPEKHWKVLETLRDPLAKVPVTREEPNVLLLDMAQWRWDEEPEFMPLEEIRRLDAAIRVKAGIPPKSGKQPWCLPQEIPEHTQTLRFRFDSEITVEGACLACEDLNVSKIYFDGQLLTGEDVGYFADECMRKTPLPVITPGSHTIDITKPLAPRTYTEASYLLGEFHVRLEGVEKTLTAPKEQLGFASVTEQGMPFYGGNLRYSIPLEVPENGCAARIHVPHYRGALISVRVDGEEAGKIVYAPYDLMVENLDKGSHTVELTLFGNRHNTFGALHVADSKMFRSAPPSWSMKEDRFRYSYSLKEFGIFDSPVIELLKEE